MKGRCLSEAKINALMQVCFEDPTPIGYRDAALIAILRGAGLRRGEEVKQRAIQAINVPKRRR